MRKIRQDSTWFSPFELVYGAKPKGILGLHKDITEHNMSETKKNTSICNKSKRKDCSSLEGGNGIMETAGQQHWEYANNGTKLRTSIPETKCEYYCQKKNS